ncbi:MAG: GAF domain-containing protein [Clostridia bacterium]|nr:GAF domain-containing protein [Clostridia bacterium]
MFNISDNLSADKNEMYAEIFEYAKMLMDGERDSIANMANISALLNQALDHINWVGFYIAREGQLVLGPFQGKAACIRIEMGKGVCGTAYQTAQVQLVDDVHEFPGHIACDAESRSEIVVPILVNGAVAAVLDIDSPIVKRFDESDKKNLIEICKLISQSCDFTNM